MAMNKKSNNGQPVIPPLATASWLIENTCLTFLQIGEFCGLEEVEVKSIADGFLARNMLPISPIKMGVLTKQEICDREKDGKPLKNTFDLLKGLDLKIQKQKKYIPLAQRKNRPEAVLWLLQYHPELTDAQIRKLTRTTKNTIQKMKDKTYEGYEELTAKDPVTVGFCTQKVLDAEIKKALNKTEEAQNKKKKTTKKSRSKKNK